MASSEESPSRIADRQYGRRGARMLLSHATSRVLGILQRDGRDWQKAYAHIRTHFAPMPDKPGEHTLFLTRYRNEAAVRDLIRKAASGPSRMAEHSRILGCPEAFVNACFERDFAEPIGVKRDGTLVRTLAVFVDRDARLLSAYPS
jgi:hypothetical protein